MAYRLMPALVHFHQVSFHYEDGPLVFDRIDLSIPVHKITAIMGPSGTGKTTLLRLIGGQCQASTGRVTFANQVIAQLTHQQLYAMRKRMGMLFQASGLLTHLNVFDNVAFPIRMHTPLSETLIRTLVLLKLQMVGLRGAHHLMPSMLSGGMARRVALARAIALDAELLMYDEPFAGQDPISMGVLVQLIRTLNDALGLTSIIVSHDVQEILRLADYVYVIAGKQVIAQGSPEEIRSNATEQLQQFVQGLPDGPVPFDYPAASIDQDFLEGASCSLR